MNDLVLWQFRYSHYNEKVRWALDYKGLPHRRRSLLAGMHIARVLWMTGRKSVPVLQIDGRAVADSTRIIAALEELKPEPPLYPRDQEQRRRALVLEDFFDEQLGPQLRRVWFYYLLPDADFSAAQISVGFGAATRRLYRTFFPAIRAAMRADMKIDPETATASRVKVDEALDRIEAELQPSGYLVGDGFTVADMTAAALLCPLTLPPQFPYPLITPLPKAAAEYRDSFAQRRAIQWALDIYRRHRGASSAVE